MVRQIFKYAWGEEKIIDPLFLESGLFDPIGVEAPQFVEQLWLGKGLISIWSATFEVGFCVVIHNIIHLDPSVQALDFLLSLIPFHPLSDNWDVEE